MPVTTVERTLVDLARVLPPEVSARVVGDAVRISAAQQPALDRELEAARGRSGAALARAAVAAADPRLESVLEEELLALLLSVGPAPIPQYEVVVDGRFLARVDFAYPAIRLAVEADGYATHGPRPAFERDRERSALLQLARWTLLSFTAVQIRQRPGWVVEVVSRALLQRRGNGRYGRVATSSPSGLRMPV